jgi:hypothetical protein
MRDANKIKAAWRKSDEVWWPGGPNDPDVCLLRIEPSTAELWDGPASAIVTAFEFAKARLTGEEPKLGENRKVKRGERSCAIDCTFRLIRPTPRAPPL